MSEADTKERIDTDAVAQMLDDEADASTDHALLMKLARAAANYTKSIIPRIRVFGSDGNDNQA